jgi:hypothetical protein
MISGRRVKRAAFLMAGKTHAKAVRNECVGSFGKSVGLV